MRHARGAPEQVSLLLFDLIAAIACYVGAAYYVFNVSAATYLLYEGGLNAAAFAATTVVILMYFRGLYSTRRYLDMMQDLSLALGGAFILHAVVVYMQGGFALPVRVLMLGTLGFAAQFSLRAAYQRWRSPAARAERLLFVGATPLNRSMAARIASGPEPAYAVAGFLDDKLSQGTALEGGSVLGPLQALPAVARDLQPHRIVIDLAGDIAAMTKIVGVDRRMEEPDELYESLFGRVCEARLQPSALLFRNHWSVSRGMLALQAVYTNLLALAALTLFLPLLIGIAILVKLSSRGPVCETEQVMGWRQAEFKRLRFRCRDLKRTATGERYEETPLGRRLRRLRLAGLPQLINVLRGELAFVGPPPVRAEAASALMSALPWYRLRFAVKPGIAGWSQLNAHPGQDAMTALAYDLYYIKRISPAFDLSIALDSLLKTGAFAGAYPAGSAN